MGWKLKGRPVTQKATRKLAEEFMKMEAPPYDRPLSERRLQVYRKLIAEGMFRPVTWAVVECRETGGIYRVNGKHTSTLLASADKSPDLYVTVEEYVCDTLEDVSKLYATFDSALQMRSARDIYCSFASVLPELRDMPAQFISSLVGGLAYQKWRETTYQKQPVERAELLVDAVPFAVWCHNLLHLRGQEKQCRHLRRQPVIACMFDTYAKDAEDCDVFWEAVRSESGPSPELPDRKLSRYLLTTGVDTGKGALSKVRRPVTPREMYCKCLHAWNAWRRDQSTNLNYYADKPVPEIV